MRRAGERCMFLIERKPTRALRRPAAPPAAPCQLALGVPPGCASRSSTIGGDWHSLDVVKAPCGCRSGIQRRHSEHDGENRLQYARNHRQRRRASRAYRRTLHFKEADTYMMLRAAFPARPFPFGELRNNPVFRQRKGTACRPPDVDLREV